MCSTAKLLVLSGGGGLTSEHEEDPSGHFIRVLEAVEVELSDAHGHGVLDGPDEVPEVFHAVLQDEEEESREAEEDDGELDDEGGEAREAELDGRCDLWEENQMCGRGFETEEAIVSLDNLVFDLARRHWKFLNQLRLKRWVTYKKGLL